jgi:hypothetical protein
MSATHFLEDKMADKLSAVRVRLFAKDIALIKKLVKQDGVALATRLRTYIHMMLNPKPQLYAFSFWIPGGEHEAVPGDESHEYSECFAVGVAETEDHAREVLTEAFKERGYDSRWLAKGCVKRIVKRPIDKPTYLGAVMG